MGKFSLSIFFLSCAGHKNSPVCTANQAVFIQSLPRAVELSLQGGLHWPVGVPQHVVAGASLKDDSAPLSGSTGRRNTGVKGLFSFW